MKQELWETIYGIEHTCPMIELKGIWLLKPPSYAMFWKKNPNTMIFESDISDTWPQ